MRAHLHAVPINARFPGRCACGAEFEQGARVQYHSASKRVVACPTCTEERIERALAALPEDQR